MWQPVKTPKLQMEQSEWAGLASCNSFTSTVYHIFYWLLNHQSTGFCVYIFLSCNRKH